MKNILITLLFVATSIVTLSLSKGFAQTYSGPESVEYDPTGHRYFVSNTQSGQILARDASGNLSVFVNNVSPSPYGLEMAWGNLYACCGGKIYGYDMSGTQIFNVNLGATFLNGIAHDNSGNLYATDFSAKKIYRININTSSYNVFVQTAQLPSNSPNGIIWDQGQNRLLVVTWSSNAPILAVSVADSSVTTIASTSLSSCDGIAEDGAGNFYVSNWGSQSVVKFPNDFSTQTTVMTGLHNPADIFYNIYTDTLAVPNSSTSSNTVVFQSFAPGTSITVCNDVPLTLYPDSISFGASDGFVSGTDSMLYCVIKNTSNYSFAYPQARFNFIDALPAGTTVDAGSTGFIVFASSWNPGEERPVKCYFNSSAPIPDGYLMHFIMSVTNLAPSSVDTCAFSDTFLVVMDFPNAICDCIDFSFNPFPNPASDKISISSIGYDVSTIEFYDVLGRKIRTEKMNSQDEIFSIEDFSSGVYFIHALNNEGKFILSRKFVKQ